MLATFRDRRMAMQFRVRFNIAWKIIFAVHLYHNINFKFIYIHVPAVAALKFG
jgi:hypothetical protein